MKTPKTNRKQAVREYNFNKGMRGKYASRYDDAVSQAQSPASLEKSITGAELAKSGFVGLWVDRTDIGDTLEFARKLRKQAETRHHDVPLSAMFDKIQPAKVGSKSKKQSQPRKYA